MTVQAPGTQTRSFCYVSDMVSFCILYLSQVLVCDLTGRTILRWLEWHETDLEGEFFENSFNPLWICVI